MKNQKLYYCKKFDCILIMKIIALVLSLMFLVGCTGLFSDLFFDNVFMFVVPDNGGMNEYDSGFVSLLSSLDTPSKIANYMQNNFVFKLHDGRWLPYEMYKYKWGDCGDFATFMLYFANYHGYNVKRCRFKMIDSIEHAIVVFDWGNYFTYSSDQYYFNAHFSSIWNIIKDCDKYYKWNVDYTEPYKLENWNWFLYKNY